MKIYYAYKSIWHQVCWVLCVNTCNRKSEAASYAYCAFGLKQGQSVVHPYDILGEVIIPVSFFYIVML